MALKRDIILALGSAAIGAFSSLAVAGFGFVNKDRELDIQMLNIALGILREDPKQSKISAAREWAIDVINISAPVQINGDARQQLIDNKIPLPSGFARESYSPEQVEYLRKEKERNQREWDRAFELIPNTPSNGSR